MSKIKLLIHEVFRKAEEETGKKTKNGLATYLWSYFDEREPRCINEKTLSRYYDAFILGIKKEINPDEGTLNRLSKYIGYETFADFSTTFIKKDDETNKTTVKVSVDEEETSLTEKLSNIIINITNEQHFKMPEFLKQNGIGIMEIALVAFLLTGNVVFSGSKKSEDNKALGFMSDTSYSGKKYMYWNGERFIATDSSNLGPQIEVVALDLDNLRYMKRITRTDTLTVANSLGKVWYDKSNGEVEFFTSFGINPENGKTLKQATDHIINFYAGQNVDSIIIE